MSHRLEFDHEFFSRNQCRLCTLLSLFSTDVPSQPPNRIVDCRIWGRARMCARKFTGTLIATQTHALRRDPPQTGGTLSSPKTAVPCAPILSACCAPISGTRRRQEMVQLFSLCLCLMTAIMTSALPGDRRLGLVSTILDDVKSEIKKLTGAVRARRPKSSSRSEASYIAIKIFTGTTCSTYSNIVYVLQNICMPNIDQGNFKGFIIYYSHLLLAQLDLNQPRRQRDAKGHEDGQGDEGEVRAETRVLLPLSLAVAVVVARF